MGYTQNHPPNQDGDGSGGQCGLGQRLRDRRGYHVCSVLSPDVYGDIFSVKFEFLVEVSTNFIPEFEVAVVSGRVDVVGRALVVKFSSTSRRVRID